MPLEAVSLDGRTLEGGGQLLRLAVSLSALTYLPVHVWDIRANRAPRKAGQQAGGLKPAHLAAVEWLAKATGAETQGMVKGSSDLQFQPHERSSGTNTDESISEHEYQTGTWQDVFDSESLIRSETYIKLTSPGSVCLILQAILPYLLFHSSKMLTQEIQPDSEQIASVPLRVTIEGGTNVSKSPSVEYISQVLIPLLVEKVGIPPMAAKVIKRGWSSGRADVGSVQFDLKPFSSGSKLPEFHFTNRGEVVKMHVSILASDSNMRDKLRGKVVEGLLARHPNVEIFFPVEEDTKSGARLYLLIVAETSNGYRLGRDCLWERKTNSATLEAITGTVIKELDKELERGGCVDEYMQDQLVVFQALAKGRSTVNSGKDMDATLHTKTARWVAEQLLGMPFDEQGTCSGCAFEVGESFIKRTSQGAIESSTMELERMRIS
ncbi:MAG: hypothetical protein Q9212_002088 [Teloschistes hypoglaucus]